MLCSITLTQDEAVGSKHLGLDNIISMFTNKERKAHSRDNSSQLPRNTTSKDISAWPLDFLCSITPLGKFQSSTVSLLSQKGLVPVTVLPRTLTLPGHSLASETTKELGVEEGIGGKMSTVPNRNSWQTSPSTDGIRHS